VEVGEMDAENARGVDGAVFVVAVGERRSPGRAERGPVVGEEQHGARKQTERVPRERAHAEESRVDADDPDDRRGFVFAEQRGASGQPCE